MGLGNRDDYWQMTYPDRRWFAGNAALANQLDYGEWFLKAVDEGIAVLDADRTFSTREVLAAIAKQRNERAARKRKQTA